MTRHERHLQHSQCPIEGPNMSLRSAIDHTPDKDLMLWSNGKLSFGDVRYSRQDNNGVHCKAGPSTSEDYEPIGAESYLHIDQDVVRDQGPSSTSGTLDDRPEIHSTIHLNAPDYQRPCYDAAPMKDVTRSTSRRQGRQPLSTRFLEETGMSKLLTRLSQNMDPKEKAIVESCAILFEFCIGALMTNQSKQTEEIKSHTSTVISNLEQQVADLKQELDQKHKELIVNQKSMMKNDQKAQQVQEKLLVMQQDMNAMQEKAFNRLVDIHDRVQAVLVQTYELFEYPIPRLFIVLPVEPDLLNRLNPFTHKFKLYFLCECGEHTKKTASSNKSHHVHLAKHEGYELVRPTEFFDRYGPYIITMLEMVKYGIAAAGVVVPRLVQLNVLDEIEDFEEIIDIAKEKFEPLLDKSITYIKDTVGTIYQAMNSPSEESTAYREALEGADLRLLASFLNKRDEEKTLGNLYRTVTDDGHVKWVCFDHYREDYKSAIKDRFSKTVTMNHGTYDEEQGKVKIEFSTPLTAQQFYANLQEARGVSELDITLAWDVTKADIQAFCDAILQSNVSILVLNGNHFQSPTRDALNWNTRFNPIIQLLASGKVQSFTMENCPRFLDRISGSGQWHGPSLRVLRIESDVSESRAALDNVSSLCTWFPNLIAFSLGCSNMKEAFAYLQEPIRRLRQLSTLTLWKEFNADSITIQVKNGMTISLGLTICKGDYTYFLPTGILTQLTLISESLCQGFDFKKVLQTNRSLSKISLRTSNIWETLRRFDSLAIGREQPLQLKIAGSHRYPKTVIQIEFWDPNRTYEDHPIGVAIQGWKTAMYIQQWDVRTLKVAVDEGFVNVDKEIVDVFGRMAEKIPALASHLELDISKATIRDINVVQSALQVMMSICSLRLMCNQPKDPDVCSIFCGGLGPQFWSRLSELHLKGDHVNIWMHYLSQTATRQSMPLLKHISIKGVKLVIPSVLSSSVHWIISMVSPTEEGRSLESLSLRKLCLTDHDWEFLINAIDFSVLRTLKVRYGELGESQVLRLVERISDESSLQSLRLEQLNWTLRARRAILGLRVSSIRLRP